jgi:two-component system sensor histidine kinase KdpD
MSDERRDPAKRAWPDTPPQEAARETRGRLKIFLGATHGVGKTYEMLSSARARRLEGLDVVIGALDTHGRRETEALVEGFDVLQKREADGTGNLTREIDLDAILLRRPQLVLIDDLAHPNAPGSRHPKRHQDVEDLIAAGLEVWTTLNIEHVESLNDIVAQITRIRVRETVPDSILDQADEIELVDFTPEDLIRRMKEGKVHVPRAVERAVADYFSPGCLTALRELALRRTAQRVNTQLLTHVHANAIPGPLAASERVLVGISEGRRAVELVRYAKRFADQLHAPWMAVYVETFRSAQLSEEQRDRISDALRLAERLGADAVTVPSSGRSVAVDVIDKANSNGTTQIVIGKTTRPRWSEILHRSVVHELVRSAGSISVHIVAGEQPVGDPVPNKWMGMRSSAEGVAIVPLLIALIAVLAALAMGRAIEPFVGLNTVDLVFLTAVVAVAVKFGLWPSLLAVAASSLCYNFFFIPPFYTFSIGDPTNVAAFLFFTVVAVLVSNLAARVRLQAVTARNRVRITESLYSFSRKLARVTTLDDALWATAFQIASMVKVRVVLLLPDVGGGLTVRAGYPPEDMLGDTDIAAANWAYEHNHVAGRGADTLPGAHRLFLPMRTGRGAIGVVGLESDRPGPLLTPELHRLLDALADQAALAIERVNLVEDVEGAKRAAETDRLRQALLTSISHDLKTPLAAIMGAAGALRDFRSLLDESAKIDLVETIQDESERLTRFIANLLDMTKLESGAVVPNKGPHEVGEIVGSALQRATKVLAGNTVAIALAPDIPMVDVDAVLFEQVLFNLLDNAAKYAPPATMIRIQGWRSDDGGTVHLQVIDEGDGIPPEDLEHIFEKFRRAQKGDSVRAGTGLGLAVCRGFVESLGGRITAANRSDRSGAVFTITLPASPTKVALDDIA